MGRNLVIFSDGTWKEGGEGHPSNVYKLFNMVQDRTRQQIVFYDSGVGTGFWKFLGGATGFGISRNIKDCYRFLFENFQADDKIFLFGFSRGAATVRSLSGFLHMFGILPRSRGKLIDRAYDIYRCGDEDREERAKAFVAKHHRMWCKVEFLGVWDTVTALGFPIQAVAHLLNRLGLFRHEFHDLRLSRSVVHARHALAVDDERKNFHPTLWDLDLHPGQTMQQVWFPGVHTDVGGGYAEHGLSDLSLGWMIGHAVERGLLLYRKDATPPMQPNAEGVLHDSRAGIGWIYPKARRTWPAPHGKPVVHASVRERKRNQRNEPEPPYDPWVMKLDPEVVG